MNDISVSELMDLPLIPKSKVFSKYEIWRILEYCLSERSEYIRNDGHFYTHIGFLNISDIENELNDVLASVLVMNHSDVGEIIVHITKNLTHPQIGWIKRVCGVKD